MEDQPSAITTPEAFEQYLVQQGFEQSSRNRAAYQNSGCPRYRFVILKRVVRLEEKEPDKGKVWHLDSSYSVSRHLNLAQWVVNNCNSITGTGPSRKTVKKPRDFVLLFALALVSLAIGTVLALSLLEAADGRPRGRELSAAVLTSGPFLICGLAMCVLLLRWWRDHRKFNRSSQFVKARVTGRRQDREFGEGSRPLSSNYLIVGFFQSGSDTAGRRIEIRAKVGEHVFGMYLTGSPIDLQYATEDPRIAKLPGE